MPDLTRRRYRERQDCWHVYYGDVHVGTIARRVGIRPSGRAWGWICGFYPGSEPGEFRDYPFATGAGPANLKSRSGFPMGGS
jgi:hypothetical protein